MSKRETKNSVSTTRLAWDTFNLHSSAMLCLFAANIALRVVAYAPLYLLLTQKQASIPGFYYIAATIILGVLLVLPARVYSHARVRHLLSGTRYSPVIDDNGRQEKLRPICVNADTKGIYPDYWHCLRFSLIRFGLGMLWGLPCAALTGAWCYGYLVMNFNEFMPILGKISAVFGGSYYDLGTAVWMIVIALTGVLFFFGWRRGMVSDFTRIVGRTDRHVLEVAAEVRKGNGKRLARHTLSQIPYLLPSLLACAYVLYRYVIASVEWSASLTTNATKLMAMLKAPLPSQALTLLLLIILCVHAPLLFFRKLRSASLMYSLYADRAARQKEKRHAA